MLHLHADREKLGQGQLDESKRGRIAGHEVPEIECARHPRVFGTNEMGILENSEDGSIAQCRLVEVLQHVRYNHQGHETVEVSPVRQ